EVMDETRQRRAGRSIAVSSLWVGQARRTLSAVILGLDPRIQPRNALNRRGVTAVSVVLLDSRVKPENDGGEGEGGGRRRAASVLPGRPHPASASPQPPSP